MRKQIVASVLLVSIAALAVLSSPAVASTSIDLEVDGETVEDGDTVEVEEVTEMEVYVESDEELNFVRTSLGTEEYTVGVNATEFRLNQTLTTLLGDNSYTVYVEDLEENSSSLSVTLERPPTTEVELRQAVRRYEQRLDRMQSEMNELENHSSNLTEENERLRSEIDDLESDTGGQDRLIPLPGFGFVAAFAALSTFTLLARRR